jgi:hypothetical protein
MGYPFKATAGDIVNDAAIELGLISARITDPYAETNPTLVQLCQFLNALGLDLKNYRTWQQFTFSETLTMQASDVGAKAFTSSHYKTIPLTLWNTTTGERVEEITLEDYAAYVATSTDPVRESYTVHNSHFRFLPVLTDEELLYTYVLYGISPNWVATSVATAPPTLEEVSAYTDYPMFDRRLLVTGVKLYFMRAKGFDTSAAQRDYDAALAAAEQNDAPAPVLNISGRRSVFAPLRFNIPIDGYGS